MDAKILGLHHVTATVAGAQPDVDFYVGVLGLRLVKKTVNFDNRGVYHFYYGDEAGSPGRLMTTFPYQGQGVRAGERGAGQITVTSFSVPPGSLGRWRRRLDAHGVPFGEGNAGFGAPALLVQDPSGLVVELIEGEGDERAPWTGGGVSAELAIRGLHGVTLTLHRAEPTLDLLTGPLGWRVVAEQGARTRVAVGADRPGHYLELLASPDAPPAVNGIGTVHHVAMCVAGDAEQLSFREELMRQGHRVTEVRDRQYFRSIYFREPGGVLFEIATAGPGFAVDEEVGALGRALRLPPWEETEREAIEAGLPAVSVPA